MDSERPGFEPQLDDEISEVVEEKLRRDTLTPNQRRGEDLESEWTNRTVDIQELKKPQLESYIEWLERPDTKSNPDSDMSKRALLKEARERLSTL